MFGFGKKDKRPYVLYGHAGNVKATLNKTIYTSLVSMLSDDNSHETDNRLTLLLKTTLNIANATGVDIKINYGDSIERDGDYILKSRDGVSKAYLNEKILKFLIDELRESEGHLSNRSLTILKNTQINLNTRAVGTVRLVINRGDYIE